MNFHHPIFFKFKAFNIGESNLYNENKYKIDHTKAKEYYEEYVTDPSLNKLHWTNILIKSEPGSLESMIEHQAYLCTREARMDVIASFEGIYEALDKERQLITEKFGEYAKDLMFEILLINFCNKKKVQSIEEF